MLLWLSSQIIIVEEISLTIKKNKKIIPSMIISLFTVTDNVVNRVVFRPRKNSPPGDNYSSFRGRNKEGHNCGKGKEIAKTDRELIAFLVNCRSGDESRSAARNEMAAQEIEENDSGH